jgi:serine/threonine protein kinase
LPSYLSDSAKDLISKMLVTDSLKRITIEGIRSHPWFLQDLPRYLSVAPRVGQHLENIDEAVLANVVHRTRFPRDKIYKALKKGRRNHYTVAYHLIKDAQDELDTSVISLRHQEEAAAAALNASPPSPVSSVVVPMHPSPGPGGGPRGTHNHHVPTIPLAPQDPQQLRSGDGNAAPSTPVLASGPTDMVLQTPRGEASAAEQNDGGRQLPPRRWNVGIVLSRLDPAEAMLEIYRTLHKLQWRWKTPSNQTFQVRVLVIKPGLVKPVRLCLQLFKTATGFNLDIHRLDGDMIPFLAVCAQLYHEIR